MTDDNTQTPHGQWKAGAKALAAFQQAAYAAGKTGKAQGRLFSSLKDIIKTIKDNSAGLGLSHAETWHPLGTDHAVLRVTLYHESGESIWSELPVDVTQKNRSGSREQAQGSAMTYARRYLLLGIYGLANDDEDDDGEAAIQPSAAASKPSRSSTTKASPEPPSPAKPAATKAAGGNGELNAEEWAKAKAIIKAHPEVKTLFIDAFYKDVTSLKATMVSTKEHLEMLLAQEEAQKQIDAALHGAQNLAAATNGEVVA